MFLACSQVEAHQNFLFLIKVIYYIQTIISNTITFIFAAQPDSLLYIGSN